MKSSAEQLYEAVAALGGYNPSKPELLSSGDYSSSLGEFKRASDIALEISEKFESHSSMLSKGWKTVSDFAKDIGNMVSVNLSGVAQEISGYTKATINEESELQAAATKANEASSTLLDEINNIE